MILVLVLVLRGPSTGEEVMYIYMGGVGGYGYVWEGFEFGGFLLNGGCAVE